MVYSIRSLKMELVLSLLAQALSCFLWLRQLSQPTKTPTTNATNSGNYHALAQRPTDATNIAGKKESDFLHPNNANASLEKRRKPATEPTTPVASPSRFMHHKPGKIVQMSQLLLRVQQRLETKAEEPIEDNYFRIHVKNFPEENKGFSGTMDLGRC